MRWLSIAALLAAGCFCSDPWSKFPEQTPPDEQYSVGGSVYGDDVYVWRCLRGQHVVVHQYSAEMTCRAPQRETCACGELTDFERKTQGQKRMPARDTRSWR